MIIEQPFTPLSVEELPAKAEQLKKDGYRIVQICCNPLDEDFELIYSFDKNYEHVIFRIIIPREGGTIPSITKDYLCAFTYENELKDLFGIKVTDLALDFDGNFIQSKVKLPFVADRPIIRKNGDSEANPDEKETSASD